MRFIWPDARRSRFVYHIVDILGSHSKRGAQVRAHHFCAGLNHYLSDYHFEHTFVSSSEETLTLDDLDLICGTPQKLSLTPFERPEDLKLGVTLCQAVAIYLHSTASQDYSLLDNSTPRYLFQSKYFGRTAGGFEPYLYCGRGSLLRSPTRWRCRGSRFS